VARRSRKRRRRSAGPQPNPAQRPAPASEPHSAPRSRQARRRSADDRPPAPWGSFPLVELVVLVAMLLLVGGFIVSGSQGAVMIGTGLALGSLAGLEVAIREHFAGYSSHTMLLAGMAGVIVLAALFFLGPSGLPPVARIAVAGAVFALVAWGLIVAFRRRSGGQAFRVRGFRG
jgi:hypothetical protein